MVEYFLGSHAWWKKNTGDVEVQIGDVTATMKSAADEAVVDDSFHLDDEEVVADTTLAPSSQKTIEADEAAMKPDIPFYNWGSRPNKKAAPVQARARGHLGRKVRELQHFSSTHKDRPPAHAVLLQPPESDQVGFRSVNHPHPPLKELGLQDNPRGYRVGTRIEQCQTSGTPESCNLASITEQQSTVLMYYKDT